MEVTDGVITKCSYDFTISDIEIPNQLDGQTITGIGDRCFSYWMDKNQITKIKLPSSLIFIGESAFGFNAITELDLSSCTKLQTIETEAFSGNSPLKFVDVRNCTNLKTIGKRCFKYCNVTKLKLSGCDSLKTIEEDAFINNSIDSLDFSNCKSLETIETYSFANNKIEHLNLTGCNALSEIKQAAFEKNKITSVVFDECTALRTIDKFAFYNNKINTLNFGTNTNLVFINTYAFAKNEISSVNLQNCAHLAFIGDGAFHENNVTCILLPEVSYQGFGNWIAADGNKINAGECASNFEQNYRVDLTYTLKDEDVEMFNGEVSLRLNELIFKSIVIPDSLVGQKVTCIWGGFSDKGITSVIFPKTLEEISSASFMDNNIESLDFSNCLNLKTIAYNAFSENNIKHLNLKNCTKLEEIGSEAFYKNDLTELDFSHCSSLKYIKDWAFLWNNLNAVNLEGCTALEEIGETAFYSQNISELNFSDCVSLKTIGKGAFGFNNLNAVDLTKCTALFLIDERAFDGNPMEGFTLPNPKYEGFQHWQDEFDNTYQPGDYIPNLLLMRTFNAIKNNIPIKAEIIEVLPMEIYPNPASNFITLSGINNENVLIYNMMGEKVLEFEVTSNKIINISNLKNGKYILKTKSYSKPFVKIQ